MNESPTTDGVKEVILETWREFFDLTTDLFAKGPAHVYRGQANYDWTLRSSIDRHESLYPRRKNLIGGTPEYFDSAPFTEDEHLNAFKRAIRGRRGQNPPPMAEDELWALGQHHGLATPLLDWTRSPFAALFFAFEQEKCFVTQDKWCEPEYRGVYVLSWHTIATSAKDNPQGVRLLSPEGDADYRLISQAALFIRLPRRADLESYVREHSDGDRHTPVFTKIKIPSQDRHECLVALNKMNINYMTLFPDIDGAAKHVNSLWQPGHEDSIAYV